MTGSRLRPVDLAREHRLSTQAIRNYEDAGILPPAERTESGYRIYRERHAQALRAFLALIPGHGHATATAIMRAAHHDAENAFALIDESHVQLREDRRTLSAVDKALRNLVPDEQARGGPMFIGPLARRLGVRPATLRKWEAAGLVRPQRDKQTGYRYYDAADVRDAQLVHQLRRGGYLLEQIAPVLEQVREAGGVAPLEATLADWRERLTARGRAMLAGAAALDVYLKAL